LDQRLRIKKAERIKNEASKSSDAEQQRKEVSQILQFMTACAAENCTSAHRLNELVRSRAPAENLREGGATEKTIPKNSTIKPASTLSESYV